MAKKRVKKRRSKPKLAEGHVDANGIPTTKKPPARQKVSPEQHTAMMERELRRYVKRNGGFRKGLPSAHKEVALRLMKKLGRKKPEWDKSIVLPGLDNPTVARLLVT